MATTTNSDLTRQQLDELDALLQRMLASPLPSDAKAPVAPLPAPAPLPQSGSWRFDQPLGSVQSPYSSPLFSDRLPLGEQANVFGSSQVERPATVTRLPTPQPLPLPPESAPVEPAEVEQPSEYLPPRAPNREVPVTPSILFTPPSESLAPPAMMREPLVSEPPPLPSRFVTPTPAMMASPLTETLPNLPSFGRIDLTEPSREQGPDIVIPNPASIVVSNPRPQHAGIPLLDWPLYGSNILIESGLRTFGPLGEVLIRPTTKFVLGIIGGTLLIGAVSYTTYAQGWLAKLGI